MCFFFVTIKGCLFILLKITKINAGNTFNSVDLNKNGACGLTDRASLTSQDPLLRLRAWVLSYFLLIK